MRLIYSALHYAVLPILLLRLYLRSLREPAYRDRLHQRFGRVSLSPDRRPLIWLHAVSVGEVMAAAPVIEHLLATQGGHRLLVTTTTPTGATVVQQRFGDRVAHSYAPWDLPGPVRRFLTRTRPVLLLLMETELWPNWLYCCEQFDVPALVVNARLSERSANGYRRGGRLASQMLGRLDHVACQSAADARRFAGLGVCKQALTITGSTKFDSSIDQEALTTVETLRRELQAGERCVVVACSVHPAELSPVLDAFGQLRAVYPDAVLLLAPRRIERAAEAAGASAAAGFTVVHRSRGELPDAQGGVLLIDTIGELSVLCGAASVAFVGGSLVPRGGQNPLEPARWGLPVLVGPHTHNFSQSVEQLRKAGGLVVVRDGSALGDWWVKLAGDEPLAAQMGDAARTLVEENVGAMARLAPLLAARLQANR